MHHCKPMGKKFNAYLKKWDSLAKFLKSVSTNLDKISGPGPDGGKKVELVSIRMLEFCYVRCSATS